jgi:hypothetical protein
VSAPTPAGRRPRVVEAAFWVLVVGAVLLMVGGLLAATLSFDTVRSATALSISDEQLRNYLSLHRGAGIVCVLAGGGLGFLAGRTRSGDARFRHATIGLALAIIVVVGLAAVFAGIHLLTLLSLLPIIVGMLLLTRPAATAWSGTGGRP